MTEPTFNDTKLPSPKVPTPLRIAATLLRASFIFLLGIETLRIMMPERESLFSAYVKWGDLARAALGLGVCVWLAMRLFKRPQTVKGYRVWLYLGLVAVPLALICLIAIW